MWNERRMTSGPGQTKAGAASCRLDAIGEDRPLSLVRNSCEHRRARRPPASSEPLRGITSIPARMSSATRTQRESRPGTTSRRRERLKRTETGRAAPNEGGTRPSCGSSRSIPRNDRSPVGTPSTHWWRYASRDRTHRSARDWQRYVVGKVLLSPRTAKDPGAGAGGVATIKVAGARVGRLLPSPIWSAGATRPARGTNVAAGRAADSYATASGPKMEDWNCTS